MLPRIVAATSKLTGYRKPAFEVRGDGIAFVTKRKPKYESQSNYGKDDQDTPMDGVTHGPILRSYEEPVPIFDGRAPFKLVQYNALPQREEELERGDFALIAYTLSGWMSQAGQRVTCNIQFAVLLREYDTNDKVCAAGSTESRPDLFEEKYIGVDSQTAMGKYDLAGKTSKAEQPKGKILMDGPCM
ncbi:hypothetical protein BDZ89DRAFT_1035775 [Hymenopellis radicata]|nr:hypothetical protein BDZ89DRAFT_1035775 [Hymenopellis radicata]